MGFIYFKSDECDDCGKIDCICIKVDCWDKHSDECAGDNCAWVDFQNEDLNNFRIKEAEKFICNHEILKTDTSKYLDNSAKNK